MMTWLQLMIIMIALMIRSFWSELKLTNFHLCFQPCMPLTFNTGDSVIFVHWHLFHRQGHHQHLHIVIIIIITIIMIKMTILTSCLAISGTSWATAPLTLRFNPRSPNPFLWWRLSWWWLQLRSEEYFLRTMAYKNPLPYRWLCVMLSILTHPAQSSQLEIQKQVKLSP